MSTLCMSTVPLQLDMRGRSARSKGDAVCRIKTGAKARLVTLGAVPRLSESDVASYVPSVCTFITVAGWASPLGPL